jgi:uncharacterized protein (DUF924 family)
MSVGPPELVAFWRRAGRRAWFAKDPRFDERIRRRFAAACEAAARGELGGWEASAQGALALLLLLDQFPRNLYRGSARAFEADPLARAVAARAIARGFDRRTGPALRPFFYLPFQHSESLEDQDRAVALCETLERAGGESARAARQHREIIHRFGRFPHRNAALGRVSTPEESRFLAEGGFKG